MKVKRVLGGSNEKRNPRLGDGFICMLQYDESGELYMFYAILPEREQLAGVIQLVLHAALNQYLAFHIRVFRSELK